MFNTNYYIKIVVAMIQVGVHIEVSQINWESPPRIGVSADWGQEIVFYSKHQVWPILIYSGYNLQVPCICINISFTKQTKLQMGKTKNA